MSISLILKLNLENICINFFVQIILNEMSENKKK